MSDELDPYYEIQSKMMDEANERAARALAAALEQVRADERRKVLDEVAGAWSMAIYGATENGVASLNQAAADELKRRYPDLVAFGEWLGKMEDDG